MGELELFIYQVNLVNHVQWQILDAISFISMLKAVQSGNQCICSQYIVIIHLLQKMVMVVLILMLILMVQATDVGMDIFNRGLCLPSQIIK